MFSDMVALDKRLENKPYLEQLSPLGSSVALRIDCGVYEQLESSEEVRMVLPEASFFCECARTKEILPHRSSGLDPCAESFVPAPVADDRRATLR